jgi:simple sugar transport system ATP-binding protein
MAENDVVIRARAIHKRFGHVHALRGVDLDLRRGEILALIGDNGAGKSTLAGTIAGIIKPDEGSVEIDGQRVENPGGARMVTQMGVETVYQTLALGPDLSIADNMFLGRELTKTGASRIIGTLDRKKMAAQAQDALTRVGWDGPPTKTAVRELSGGQQQAVAVARAVYWAKQAILMDEPTAALAARQMQKTNEDIRSAAGKGLGVLVITHDIPNMLTYAHRILVMRRGRIISEKQAKQTTVAELVELMVGRDEEELGQTASAGVS